MTGDAFVGLSGLLKAGHATQRGCYAGRVVNRLAAAGVAVLIVLCACREAPDTPKIAPPHSVEDSEPFPLDLVRVIDPQTLVFRVESLAAGRVDFLLSVLPKGPYWEPELSDIILGRLLVARHLEQKADEFPIRQYIGYLSQDRRIVQVRGVHSDCVQWHNYWRRRPAELLHSGGCVFTLEFDSPTGESLDFRWGTVGP